MIRFLQPWWLLALLPVLAVAGAYVWRQFRRRAYAMRFTNVDLLRTLAPKGLGWRRHAAAGAFLLSLVALGTAMARPSVDREEPLERATVMLAIDVSLSMEADDVAPNRIEAAQEAAKQFVSELPPTYNLGLVSFAKSANVLVSPTKDRAAVIAGDRRADAGRGDRDRRGGLHLAGRDPARCPPTAPRAPRRPGSCCSPTATAPRAGRWRTPAAAAAGGQRAGLDDRVRHRHRRGRHPRASCSGCRWTGCRCSSWRRRRRATSTRPRRSTELKQVYEDMGSSIGHRVEPREVTQWYAGAALLLGLMAAAMSLLWTSRLP